MKISMNLTPTADLGLSQIVLPAAAVVPGSPFFGTAEPATAITGKQADPRRTRGPVGAHSVRVREGSTYGTANFSLTGILGRVVV